MMARDGHTIGLMARRVKELDDLAVEIRSSGGSALVLPCDVMDPDSVKTSVAKCRNELGPIDCLVMNAGIGGSTPPENFKSDLAERILRTNLISPCYLIEAVLPEMMERKRGHIVGISSLASLRGLPISAAYCASKAGLNALLESLRISLRPYAVSVTTICPGFVRTALTAANKNRMPFIVEQEDAAREIYRAIRERKRMHYFPWQLSWPVRFARWIPDSLYDRLFSRARIQKDPA